MNARPGSNKEILLKYKWKGNDIPDHYFLKCSKTGTMFEVQILHFCMVLVI